MAEYPQEVTQRFHGTPEQMAAALIGEPPAKWQSIVIEDYDPAWVDRFAAASSSLNGVLGGLIISIEHVGSTSVPGLAAKPIIDIDLLIDDTTEETWAGVPRSSAVPRTITTSWALSRCTTTRGSAARLRALTVRRSLSSASGGTGTELADIRLLDAHEALHQYPQWESDSSGYSWPEELGTLASSLGLLVELAEGLESSAGMGACLSAVSP